jgi:hypothetical protein
VFKKMAAGLQQLADFKDVLFHGSPIAGMTRLEPRTTRDVTGDAFNSDTAVFATSNAGLAIIFGVVDVKALPKHPLIKSWSAGLAPGEGFLGAQSSLPKLWQPHVLANTGYVYILPKATFIEGHGQQWKSKVAVEPAACIPVTLQDYYDAGGRIEWAAP